MKILILILMLPILCFSKDIKTPDKVLDSIYSYDKLNKIINKDLYKLNCMPNLDYYSKYRCDIVSGNALKNKAVNAKKWGNYFLTASIPADLMWLPYGIKGHEPEFCFSVALKITAACFYISSIHNNRKIKFGVNKNGVTAKMFLNDRRNKKFKERKYMR